MAPFVFLILYWILECAHKLALFPLEKFDCNSCAYDCDCCHNHGRKTSVFNGQAKKGWLHQLDTLCYWKDAHNFFAWLRAFVCHSGKREESSFVLYLPEFLYVFYLFNNFYRRFLLNRHYLTLHSYPLIRKSIKSDIPLISIFLNSS